MREGGREGGRERKEGRRGREWEEGGRGKENCLMTKVCVSSSEISLTSLGILVGKACQVAVHAFTEVLRANNVESECS